MKTIINRLTAALLTMTPLLMNAQAVNNETEGKKVTNAQMIGVGGINILDTYLTQEKYHGTEISYISHTVRQWEGRKWMRVLIHKGSMAKAESRSGEGDEMAGNYTFSYGACRQWNIMDNRFNIRAGAMAELSAGFLYNTLGSNNPAQARLSFNIAPTVAASYKFSWLNVPFQVGYEASAPLLGVMFSPNYGQSYYEIFSRGNYDHNVVGTTFISTPSLRQLLTLDISLHHTTLRIGYLGDFRQAKVNHLKYHNYSNMIVLGIVKNFKITRLKP